MQNLQKPSCCIQLCFSPSCLCKCTCLHLLSLCSIIPPSLSHPPPPSPPPRHHPPHQQPAAPNPLEWAQGAIKTQVEENQQRSKVAELEAQGNIQRAAALRRRLDAPPDAELQNDVTALAAELERRYHHLKRMPTRAELRADQRCVLNLALSSCVHPCVSCLLACALVYFLSCHVVSAHVFSFGVG